MTEDNCKIGDPKVMINSEGAPRLHRNIRIYRNISSYRVMTDRLDWVYYGYRWRCWTNLSVDDNIDLFVCCICICMLIDLVECWCTSGWSGRLDWEPPKVVESDHRSSSCHRDTKYKQNVGEGRVWGHANWRLVDIEYGWPKISWKFLLMVNWKHKVQI